MIENLHQEINNIYAGTTSIEVSYNLDLLTNGPGIFIDKTNPNSAKIVNTRELFTIGNPTVPTDRTLINFNVPTGTMDSVTNPNSYSYLRRLLDYNNYLKILGGTPSAIPVTDRDIILYIDDTIEK